MYETLTMKQVSRATPKDRDGHMARVEARSTVATLAVLYRLEPGTQQPFFEIRRWETQDGKTSELVAEIGWLTVDGDLETVTHVLPFWWDRDRALTWAREQVEMKV